MQATESKKAVRDMSFWAAFPLTCKYSKLRAYTTRYNAVVDPGFLNSEGGVADAAAV
jgi:hypothetical protein